MIPPTHEPTGYVCPFCAMLRGRPVAAPLGTDVVAETDLAVAFISPRWWRRNPGHVLVIPRAHHENLYSVPDADLSATILLVRRVAIAMREAYGCDGISTRQHNEPAGGQDVWHLHTHVFPRFADDELYRSSALPGFAEPGERARYAHLLRSVISE